MTTLALSESQREPESTDGVHQSHLVYIAQPHGAQADIGNQPFHHLAGIASRTAIEEVSLDTVKQRVGKIFPAESVECPVDMCMWCVSLEGCEAVHRAAPHPVRRVDDNLAVKLRGVGHDRLIHGRTWNGHHHHVSCR